MSNNKRLCKHISKRRQKGQKSRGKKLLRPSTRVRSLVGTGPCILGKLYRSSSHPLKEAKVHWLPEISRSHTITNLGQSFSEKSAAIRIALSF